MSSARARSPGSSKKRKVPTAAPLATHDHEPEYEFGGPLGAILLPIVLCVTVPFLYFAGNGDCVLTVDSILSQGLGSLSCVKDQLVSQQPILHVVRFCCFKI
jgi:hypothetical protein